MSQRKPSSADPAVAEETHPETCLIADEQHPEYVPGVISEYDGGHNALTHTPQGPVPPNTHASTSWPPVQPLPEPLLVPDLPHRGFPLPVNFCSAVSGRYTFGSSRRKKTLSGREPIGTPAFPKNLLSMNVRVDVDRFSPQNCISIEVKRTFPKATAHVIAEVTSDECVGLAHRRILAKITYRDGDAALIPGDQVLFEATRGRGFQYGSYKLELSGDFTTVKTYALKFRSKYYDPIEFEVDKVANAGATVTTYDISSHPNRPADLATETISLATVYQRAGFDVTMSPNTTVIPTTDAGANGTWSDGEMHNAMSTYWSRFANRPQWAMWVLFAARHDMGRSLGGVMFDDIGANHRQGTAIFTDSFIQDAPAGDANAAAWRRRMVFWTATHEMGHAFNLAHAWQKSLGNPWMPLADEPDAVAEQLADRAVAAGATEDEGDGRQQPVPVEFADDLRA